LTIDHFIYLDIMKFQLVVV